MLNKNEKIVERYYLQNLASKVCYIQGKKEGLKYPQNWHKVSKCRVARYSSDSDISILQSKEHGTSHYGGLIVCARAWACPVCAPIMQARRAERVARAFQWAYNTDERSDAIQIAQEEHDRRAFEDSQYINGFIQKKKRRQFMPTVKLLKSDLKVCMITFTTPHSKADTVQTLFPKFQDAMAFMKEQRKYKEFKQNVGYIGEITATEITFGLNGPHIHRHVLYFIKDNDDVATETVLTDFFARYWGSALQKAGLLDEAGTNQYDNFLKHGVDVIARAHESDYITKAGTEDSWGADAEITKASSKQGKKFGRTPFEILAGSAKSAKDSNTFLDYLQGTKGKAQLTFSAGFKRLIGLEELDDEQQDELDASEADNPADLLASLQYSDWSLIVKSNKRGELLKVATENGKEGIDAFINKLKHNDTHLDDEALFFKHFEKLVSRFNDFPNSFLDPEIYKTSDDMKDFVVEYYSSDLEEFEKAS
ncbi:hypothetical protein HXW73_16790 [Halomonas sp. SH5A2]|uniref:hypothetical protein n=1 Tax=Halomonas sp. SH5A2 TaxID=2749040 RepID=UPI00163F33A4|nr:hypothetical protein [Halomonas sp. SH5A2]QNI04462.1 hypothetical protein HXW73_16790 [Halomonas sp. SH5A2]